MYANMQCTVYIIILYDYYPQKLSQLVHAAYQASCLVYCTLNSNIHERSVSVEGKSRSNSVTICK